MLKAKDKQASRGNWITFAIVLALTLITMVLENVMSPGSLLFTVIKKGAVYSLVAVSMNLLNGFTGLFSLGQAGFMLLGAYAYAIFMIPEAAREGVYYLFGGSSVHFSFQEMFQHLFGASGFGGGVSLVLGVLVAIIFAGLVAALFAYLIGLPVLRLKSDYLAIATLGFAEILRAIFQWQALGKVTNGANILKGYPTFADFNITNASGKVLFRLSAVMPILLAGGGIFIIGVAVFTASSIASGLATDAHWLNVARFIQGVGSGLLSPQGVGMIQQYFRGAERGKAFSEASRDAVRSGEEAHGEEGSPGRGVGLDRLRVQAHGMDARRQDGAAHDARVLTGGL